MRNIETQKNLVITDFFMIRNITADYLIRAYGFQKDDGPNPFVHSGQKEISCGGIKFKGRFHFEKFGNLISIVMYPILEENDITEMEKQSQRFTHCVTALDGLYGKFSMKVDSTDDSMCYVADDSRGLIVATYMIFGGEEIYQGGCIHVIYKWTEDRLMLKNTMIKD